MAKITTLFLVLLSLAYSAYGQVFLQTSLNNIRSCGEEETVMIELRNVSVDQLDNVKLGTVLPDGITLVANTSPYALDPSSTSQNPVFSIGSLTAGQAVTVTFTIEAGCDLIAYADDFGIGEEKFIQLNTSVEYTLNGQSSSFSEPNGSESFNVVYPVLQLQVEPSLKNQDAVRGDQITRSFVIQNIGNSFVGAESLTISITDDRPGLSLENITYLSGVSVPNVNNSGVNREIILTDFTPFGDGDNRFEPGEEIELIEIVRLINCSQADINSDYFVQWGCNDQVCNENSNNSKDGANISIIDGRPLLNAINIDPQPVNFCGDPIPFKVVLENNASETGDLRKANALFNIDLFMATDFRSQQFASYTNFNVENSAGNLVPIIPVISGTSYRFNQQSFDQVSGGVKGMEDLDADGKLDLLPQGKINITYDLVLTCAEELTDFGVGQGNLNYNLYYLSFRGNAICGDFISTFRNGTKSFTFNTANVSGPTDLIQNEQGIYTFDVSRTKITRSYLTDECPSGEYSVKVKFPSNAYQVDLNNITFDGTVLSGNQTSDGELTILGGGPEGTYSVSVTLNCELADSSEPVSQLIWDQFYDCTGTGCCLENVARDDFEIFDHCPSGDGGGPCVRTTSFEVERTTLGYPETILGYYNELPAERVSPEDPGLNLNAVLEGDEIRGMAQGLVSSGTFNNLGAYVQYNSPYEEPSLVFTESYFQLADGSQVTAIPSETVILDAGTNIYTHKITFPLNSANTSFSSGFVFDLYFLAQVKSIVNFDAGEYSFDRFRTFHYGSQSASPTELINCESFGATLDIYKNFFEFNSFNSTSNFTCSASGSVFESRRGVSFDPFPGEFRPNTQLHEIRIELPPYLAEVSNPFLIFRHKGRFSFLNVGTGVRSTLPGGNIQYIFDNPFPFFDFNPNTNNDRLYFQYTISASCYADVPDLSEAIISEITYQNQYNNPESDLKTASTGRQYRLSKPSLNISANTIQDGFSDEVTWEVNLCNETNQFPGQSPNTWLLIEPPSNINFTSATSDGQPVELITLDNENPEKKWIQLGFLNRNVCRNIQLTASYTNCITDVVDDILLRANYACNAYPTDPTNDPCVRAEDESQGLLQLRYKNADLQTIYTKLNPSSNLCEPVPYQIEILSAGLGNMDDLKTILELPSGVRFIPGSADYRLNEGAATSLSDPTNIQEGELQGIGWDLTQSILSGGEFEPGQKILLSFDLEADCSNSDTDRFDPGIPVRFYTLGNSNCNDEIVRPFQSVINIIGFSLEGQSLIPEIAPIVLCNETANQLDISVTNPNTNVINSQELLVILPDQINYESVPDGVPTPVYDENGIYGRTLTWSLPDISPGEIASFSFIANVANGITGTVGFVTRTQLVGSGTCVETGEQCQLVATTGISSRQVEISSLGCVPDCPEPQLEIPTEIACNDPFDFNLWSGANIVVGCEDESKFFKNYLIVNDSEFSMRDSLSYTIYYDDGFSETIMFKLSAGDTLFVPATDNSDGNSFFTLRLEVGQEPFNPNNSGIIVDINPDTFDYDLCFENYQFTFFPPIEVAWDFGDGTTSTEVNPSHMYMQEGMYQITLTYCEDKTLTGQVQVASCLEDLQLIGACTQSAGQYYRWRVFNPNDEPIPITVEIPGTSYRFQEEARASGFTSLHIAVNAFFPIITPAILSPTLRVTYQDEADETVVLEEEASEEECDFQTCEECISSFAPLPGKEYMLSAWLKESNSLGTVTYESAGIALEFRDADLTLGPFKASGEIIDGWQRVYEKFTVPDEATAITVRLVNDGTNEAFFDDIRLHPFNGNMKSFVYDPITMRLAAELDENNYATFYEYDEEGALVRVKKETERGVKTIQESRNNTVKSNGQ